MSSSYDEARINEQQQRDEGFEELEALARGKVCVRCEERPRIAWLDGQYVLRCQCYPRAPALVTEQAEAKTIQRVVDRALQHQDPQVAQLTVQAVQQFFCPDATPAEALLFVQMCKATSLNPYLHDADLVKYSRTKPASIIIRAQAYRKWASHNPAYARTDGGIIVAGADGKPEYRDGVFLTIGEELLGGWAKVYSTSGDVKEWSVPIQSYLVVRNAYDNETPEVVKNTWAMHPAPRVLKEHYVARNQMPQSEWGPKAPNMIAKVAEKQCLERKFPEDIGMFLRRASDFGASAELQGPTIEGQWSEADAQPRQNPDTPTLHKEPISLSREDLFGPSPAQAHRPPPAMPDAPPAESRDLTKLRSVGDLFNACHEDFGLDSKEVLRLSGYRSPTDVTNLAAAYLQVREARDAR